MMHYMRRGFTDANMSPAPAPDLAAWVTAAGAVDVHEEVLSFPIGSLGGHGGGPAERDRQPRQHDRQLCHDWVEYVSEAGCLRLKLTITAEITGY
jgi:hypothetical protein